MAIPIVLAAVHGLSGLFRAVSVVEPSLFRPLTHLISHIASVDVKQNGPKYCDFPTDLIGAVGHQLVQQLASGEVRLLLSLLLEEESAG